jgi:N-acyl-D-amino-acid deacylase
VSFDLILRGGSVVDGSGAPARAADVGIEGAHITAVADLARAEAREVVDCRDLVVCPGFVDAHTHSDFTHLLTPHAESLVHQGVTTEVVGNCGFSAAPWRGAAPELQGGFLARYRFTPDWTDLDGYLRALDAAGSSINCATLVGHNTIRAAVVGMAARPATPDEVRAMTREVELAMEQGAVGFSSGLAYTPGSAAAMAELTTLAAACAARGGIYTTHIRSEDVRLIESVAEALETAGASGARTQLSHHPAKFPSNGRSVETLAMLDLALARGLDVACDLHPYTAGATWMIQLLPPAGFEGGVASVTTRLREPAFRRTMRQALVEATDMVAPVQLIRAGHWDKLRIDYSAATPELIGRDLAGLAAERRQDPFDTLFDVMAAQGDGLADAVVIAWVYDEQDIVAVMRHPTSLIGSDGYTLGKSGPLGAWRFHPRSYGTFPRVLARYVREQRVLSQEEAVRKMTSVPAARFKLGRRGLLARAYVADVVAFDPNAVLDLADYEHPNTLASGIRHVVVGGTRVIENGAHLSTRPGRGLRRED